jgi:hypothetical protein
MSRKIATKAVVSMLAVSAFVSLTPVSGAHAKVFDHPPKKILLQDTDSFSVECKNNKTGVIDRESVDVDSGNVTIDIPGNSPVVHKITNFSWGLHNPRDRFGAIQWEVYLQIVGWGMIGNQMVGLLLSGGERWTSHHEDDSWWGCAIY